MAMSKLLEQKDNLSPTVVGLSVKTHESKRGASRNFYVLRLYVTGANVGSTHAIANVRALCQKYLRGRHELEVVDLYQHPQLAKDEQIIASPTLLKKLPGPIRRFVGDMSDFEKILAELELNEKGLQPCG
jgi:circadian clock protein KaiB